MINRRHAQDFSIGSIDDEGRKGFRADELANVFGHNQRPQPGVVCQALTATGACLMLAMSRTERKWTSPLGSSMMTCGTSVEEANTKSGCSTGYSLPSAMRMVNGWNGAARSKARMRAFMRAESNATGSCRPSRTGKDRSVIPIPPNLVVGRERTSLKSKEGLACTCHAMLAAFLLTSVILSEPWRGERPSTLACQQSYHGIAGTRRPFIRSSARCPEGK